MSLTDIDLACTATALYLYPVKSCAALAVPEIVLDDGGWADGDRGWAVVNERGEVTWQGDHPRLALVQPRLVDGRLHLASDGAGAAATPAPEDLAPRRVKMWSDLEARHIDYAAADAGDAVAAWLSDAVGTPLRLVRLSDAARTRAGNNALHLVFSPSVAEVDAQLAAAGLGPADPRRYRANVVLSVPDAGGVAFLEESLEALEWPGGERLAITAPCVRCPVPNVDPVSAAVETRVGDTLTRLSRQRREGGTVFGVYARGAAGMILRVGDAARMALAF